ncbi:unnamed protein product [Rotaria magnacalcarata]|uniref:Uncharacterized protein n=1 Tax=Rotaria magnacalcarata TaxID=392030 RepID=A0A819KP73_9BILA|nr:unnamed protein product [Rotaria magnacalcarata]CAF3957745.1 unnamed protein product [Rotaria magnacalcarata]
MFFVVLLYLLVFCKCQTDDTTGTDGIDTSSASSIETTSGVDAFHSTATVASTYEQTFKSSTDSATNLASTSTTTQSVTNTNEISSTTPFSSSRKLTVMSTSISKGGKADPIES